MTPIIASLASLGSKVLLPCSAAPDSDEALEEDELCDTIEELDEDEEEDGTLDPAEAEEERDMDLEELPTAEEDDDELNDSSSLQPLRSSTSFSNDTLSCDKSGTGDLCLLTFSDAEPVLALSSLRFVLNNSKSN
jgi:hypothetical protein